RDLPLRPAVQVEGRHALTALDRDRGANAAPAVVRHGSLNHSNPARAARGPSAVVVVTQEAAHHGGTQVCPRDRGQPPHGLVEGLLAHLLAHGARPSSSRRACARPHYYTAREYTPLVAAARLRGRAAGGGATPTLLPAMIAPLVAAARWRRRGVRDSR